MTRRPFIVYGLLFVVLIVVHPLLLPETLRQMEGSDFFTSNFDFFMEKLADAPGVTAWLSNFLLQFFRWPFVGMLIEALLLILIAVLCGMIPWVLHRKGYSEWSVLVPIVLLLVVPMNVQIYLEAVFFFAGLVAGLRLKLQWVKSVYLLLWAIVGFFLTSFPLLILSIVLIAGYSFYKQRSILVLVAGILAIGGAVSVVFVSNEWIGFIPFEKRFTCFPEKMGSLWKYLAVFVVSIALMLVPNKGKKSWLQWSSVVLASLCAVGASVYAAVNNETKFTEKFYYISALADKKDWHTILEVIPYEETLESKMALRYALLAEAGLGTFADNVFNYPITSPEDYLYRHEVNRMSCIFNRLFYDNAGIYDEAMRMAFEYGVMTQEGICFSSLRQMAHYSILLGDFKVAEKYLEILSESTLHDSWVEQERVLLAWKKSAKQQKKPIVKDTFVNVYAMNSEMVRQAQVMPKNRKVVDYLLVGLLLQRELQKFAIVMHGFPVYKNRTLPKPYAEAAAMMVTNPQFNLHKDFKYSEDTDNEFAEFIKLKQQNQSSSAMAQYYGSYWFYYFYVNSSDNARQTGESKQVN